LILAATRDAARLFLELGTVTIVLAVGARLAARTGFSSIPLYIVAGIVLGAPRSSLSSPGIAASRDVVVEQGHPSDRVRPEPVPPRGPRWSRGLVAGAFSP